MLAAPGRKHDMNVRSAYLHMLGDAVSAFGVVIAGILVVTTQRLLARSGRVAADRRR